MFTNQVSIKDLFTSNSGNAPNRHDGSGDWDFENNSSSLSNSQQPYSQLDFPDSQEFPGSQNLSQKESNSPSKFYQRYMAKSLHNRESTQKTSNLQPKFTYQQQFEANKARAKDRDERDLLNRMLNVLKECGNEVKDAVTEVKSTLQKGSTSTDTRLAEHLSKIDETLSVNAKEYRKALEIKEKTKEENVAFREKLNEKNITINELKERIRKLEEENKNLFVKKIEELFTKNSDNLKECLEQLYDEHKKELQRFSSIHSDQQTEFVKMHENIARTHFSTLKSLEDRIDSGLAITVGNILKETQKIFAVQGGDIVQIQQEQMKKLRVIIQKEMVACIMDQMSTFKEELSLSLQKHQDNLSQQNQERNTKDTREDDMKLRYTQEMEALKRRFQKEASEIYQSQTVPSMSSTTEEFTHGASQKPTVTRSSITPASLFDYENTSRPSETELDYRGRPGYLSPRINVIDPVEIISGRRSTQSDPQLRSLFSQSKDKPFKSPMRSMADSSWSSSLMYRKTNPSPVATVKPQVQAETDTQINSHRKKGRQKKGNGKKSNQNKKTNEDDKPVIVRDYQLRGRSNGSGSKQGNQRDPSSESQSCKMLNNESQMTHLARYSEIYTFQSTPRRPPSNTDNTINYFSEEQQYNTLPSVIQRRSDVFSFEDSPLRSDITSKLSGLSHKSSNVPWNGGVIRGKEVSDDRWEAARAIGPTEPVTKHGPEPNLTLYDSESGEDEDLECASQTSSPCMSVYEVVKRMKQTKNDQPTLPQARHSTRQPSGPNPWNHLQYATGDANIAIRESKPAPPVKLAKRKRKRRY